MSKTDWQPGHLPFLPADDAGVLTKRLHWGQRNSIDPEVAVDLPEDAAFDGWLAADVPVRFFGAVVVLWGIGMIAVHCGHFPFLPATLSGTVMLWPHSGHPNVMFPEVAGCCWLCFEAAVWSDVDLVGFSVEESGMRLMVAHFGHLPFLPALAAGTRNSSPHCEQRKLIISDPDTAGLN